MSGKKSLLRETFPSVEDALARAWDRVKVLAKAERRAGRFLAPYAAAVIQEGVRLHVSGREDPRGWKRLQVKHGIKVKADAISPLYVAAKLVFAESPRGSLSRYAEAMAWAYDKLKRGLIQVDDIAALIVRQGGVRRVADDWIEKRGKKKGSWVGRGTYEGILADLPSIGFVSVRDPDVELASDVLALVRTEPSGRRRVIILDQDTTRVRNTVVRYARQRRLVRSA